ncbi:MAG: type I glyceraldehyde-3-phosphate dehydrogenase [Proteobacteria bacterium]|nr:type I glyceraldehyde-3-phosphate dehydrogenase [Pseudomonadota bacterium]
MTIRIGINGFGRIGRFALREIARGKGMKCVGVNDIVAPDVMAHLFKYDSAHGRFEGEVSSSEKSLRVNGSDIPVTCEKDPAALPWKSMECDIVLECTGKFVTREGAGAHLAAGAKRVIISAPAKEKDTPTFVYGVNHETYDAAKDAIVSAASCTTNCLAPVAKVLQDNYGIERGFMTTIHAYTNDQKLVDSPHKDLRRARAAAVSQIPTTTGAAKAVGLVLPALAGKLDGIAVRVPTVNVSLVDLVASLSRQATADEINAAMKRAADGELKGILNYVTDPCVSVDFMGDKNASNLDAGYTKVIGNMVKVLSWYDNEMGFTHQMLRLAEYMGKKL